MAEPDDCKDVHWTADLVDQCQAVAGTPWNPGPNGYILDWEIAAARRLTKPPEYWSTELEYDPGAIYTRVPVNPTYGEQHHIARFELNYGGCKREPVVCDPDNPNDCNRRAELSGNRAPQNVPAPQGNCFEPVNADRWYAFSIYLNEWELDRSLEVVTQWHQHWCIKDFGDASPPLGIATGRPYTKNENGEHIFAENGEWVISTPMWGAENPASDTIQFAAGAYACNVWTHWVVHVRWSADSEHAGLVEIWKCSTADTDLAVSRKPGARVYELVYCAHGQNTYSTTYSLVPDNRGPGNYMKFGIYKWNWGNGCTTDQKQRVMYYDNLRICDGSISPGELPRALFPPDITAQGITTRSQPKKGAELRFEHLPLPPLDAPPPKVC